MTQTIIQSQNSNNASALVITLRTIVFGLSILSILSMIEEGLSLGFSHIFLKFVRFYRDLSRTAFDMLFGWVDIVPSQPLIDMWTLSSIGMSIVLRGIYLALEDQLQPIWKKLLFGAVCVPAYLIGSFSSLGIVFAFALFLAHEQNKPMGIIGAFASHLREPIQRYVQKFTTRLTLMKRALGKVLSWFTGLIAAVYVLFLLLGTIGLWFGKPALWIIVGDTFIGKAALGNTDTALLLLEGLAVGGALQMTMRLRRTPLIEKPIWKDTSSQVQQYGLLVFLALILIFATNGFLV